MKNLDLSNVFSFMKTFPSETECRKYLAELRWKDGLYCPHCNLREKIYCYKNGDYKCSSCKKKFSLTKGTIFERSHFTLQQWFLAIHEFILSKKGISSYQLAKTIGSTQPNALFMLNRIRRACYNRKMPKLKGIVEIDETFVGGKNKNRHYDKRKKGIQGRCTKDKAPVVGFLERDGNVFLFKLSNLKKSSLQLLIRNKIELGSSIATDEYRGYHGLNKYYTHGSCNHGANKYVNGEYHTNSLEGFWSWMKRGILGIYHYVSRKHLMRYCKEYEFRYNHRKHTVEETFTTLVGQFFGARLMFKEL